MCDDSREITVNSPLFVAFIASGKGSFIFLLCVFRDPLFALYANSALLLLLFSFGAVSRRQLYSFQLKWLLLFPFFKCYVWQFSQTFYEICFVALKFNLLPLWEIEFRRPNPWPYGDLNENF